MKIDDTNIDDLICSPDTYANARLYHELFDKLRHEAPVHWTTPTNYEPFWTISKHNDIREIERQNDRFLNAPRSILQTYKEEEQIMEVTGSRKIPFESLVNMDGMHHRAHRGIAQPWLMPAKLKKLELDITNIAKEFVDRLESAGGNADFCQVVSTPYPLRVIMTILGIPQEDEELLLKYSRMLAYTTDPDIGSEEEIGATKIEAFQRFFEYFRVLAAERRKNPRDDLASIIANAQVDGEAMTELAAMSYYVIFAIAGHDTTSMSSAGGLHALLEAPEQMAKLRADPALLPTAIDEVFRWVSPIKHFFRTAVEDYRLRDQLIRAGDSLLMAFPSGNRDEEVFESPHSFKIDRSPNQHLGFGSGVHTCLGVHLAKMELRALYSELFARFDNIELAGNPAFYVSNTVQGLKHLPISCTVRRA